MDPLKPLPFLALEEKAAIVASHEVSLETKQPRCTNFSRAICIHDWFFGSIYPCPYLDTISAFLRNATILCQTEPCKSVLISVVITKYTQNIANSCALFYSYASNMKRVNVLFFPDYFFYPIKPIEVQMKVLTNMNVDVHTHFFKSLMPGTKES